MKYTTFQMAAVPALLAVTLAGCGPQEAEFDPPATDESSSEAPEGTGDPAEPEEPSSSNEEPGDDPTASAEPVEIPECLEDGDDRTIAMLDDVVIPAETIAATPSETIEVGGKTVELPGIPETEIPERVIEAGCVIVYDAPGGCLGAIEISRAVIPEAVIPERVLPAVTLPDGTVIEEEVLPAVTRDAVVVPGDRTEEVCQNTDEASEGGYVSHVYRDAVSRSSRHQRVLIQSERVRHPVWVDGELVGRTIVSRARVDSTRYGDLFIDGASLHGFWLDDAENTEVAEDENQTFFTTPSDVLFAVDEATIDPAAESELETIAAAIATLGDDVQVLVDGHTDNVRSAEHNQRLSEERAEAVAAWLTDNAGIDAGSITTRGFGFDYPRADNSTEEGRADNRRVVITAITQG
ncbi:OmpA family protein [Ruania alba]|uniref:OmpA family protein n=1 Tax=Ruania alba TaxID=648782 RepID=A0A1H5L9A6_9MICO|nr:OmpA family protein [Ruania alba]SEE73662.1 OmpA family protein [Ruania alba]